MTPLHPHHGWLSKDDSLSYTVHGSYVDPATRTRREEYWWAGDLLRAIGGATLLDVATGYVPTWHMLPYIASDLGYTVETIDFDPRTMEMPPHPAVHRQIGDMRFLPYPDNSFDVVACISVLEHLNPADQEAAAREIVRVANRHILITADASPGIAELFQSHGVFIGAATPTPAEHLNPPVYALYGEKI